MRGLIVALCVVLGLVASAQSHVDIYRYAYDAMERLQSVTMQHDGGAEVVLQSNSYDEIGRLTTQTVNDGATPIDYAYNVHGRLKTITSPNFSQALYYETAADGNAGYLNGNIKSNIIVNTTSANRTQTMRYNYTYDGLNRLTAASIVGTKISDPVLVIPVATNAEIPKESDVSPSALGNTTPTFSATYAYDLNGNVTHLTRKGLDCNKRYYVTHDNLNFSYSGNQVIKTSANLQINTHCGVNGLFEDLADEEVEYTWDANGNMTSDLNKGITSIEYNALNLPRRITFADGHITEYLYDASGRKLQTKYLVDNRAVFAASISGETDEDELMTSADSTSVETLLTRDYVENYIYADSVFERVLTPNGDFSVGSGYRYYIKDYQGNTANCVPYTGTANWRYYYPYGFPIEADAKNDDVRHLYSGKELDRMHQLGWYDFHARMLDPLRGQFTTLDPLCEIDYAISPYAFCRNNPVMNTDRTGCVVETLWDVANIVMGANSFVDNVSAGNVTAAVVDGVGIVVDVAAAILPVIPGGAGTAIKAARATDNAHDAATGVSSAMKNAERIAEGRAFEKSGITELRNSGATFDSQVTLVPLNGKGNVRGNRTRADVLLRNDGRTYSIIEYKLTPNTRLSKGQKAAKEHIDNGNGLFEIRSKSELLDLKQGQTIFIPKYDLIYKK